MTMGTTKPKMEIEIAGIKMKNPVLNAAGTMGYGSEFADFVDISIMGAFVPKGLTLKPRKGNDPSEGQRTVETPCGMLNWIGLENVGVGKFITEKLPYLREHFPETPVIVNINGETRNEYVECAKELMLVEGIAAIEVNLGCPNIEKGGAQFGKDSKAAYNVVSYVHVYTRNSFPLIVKLTADVTDICGIARAVETAGAEAISLINTTKGAAIVNGKLVTGGLSGPAIKPRALYLVSEVAKAVSIPIIGMGGIMTAQDAIDFLGAGAVAVAVGTANFHNRHAIPKIICGLEQYMLDNAIPDIRDLIGRYI